MNRLLPILAACTLGLLVVAIPNSLQAQPHGADDRVVPGTVACANLSYASGKTSKCFADNFLEQVSADSGIATTGGFDAVDAGSADLFDYPFSVMSGEGAFSLTDAEVDNLRLYLTHGGFLVASAGCSSKAWNRSFATAVERLFPATEMQTLAVEHPVFHTVYDVASSRYKSGGERLPELRTIEHEGRVVLLWSPDGLNDTDAAGKDCCCCGGNEIKSARKLNVNILAYALTH